MNAFDVTVCPPREELERYLREELDDARDDAILEHVNSCSTCRSTLEAAAGSAELWSAVREQLDAEKATPAPQEDHDIEAVLALLDASEDPARLGRIGRYEIAGVVGRGSTGVVLKAFEPSLQRLVALKILSPSLGKSGTARRRFEREGRAVAAVSHEHVVPVHAVDEHRGLPYLVMPYVAGATLERRIFEQGPLDACQVARIGLQVARALSAAHAQGIVHRDVKPANVLLENNVERALVTDFGLARVAADASLTQSGTISGTPGFMAPEQAEGQAADARSDQFSLGSTLYAALTGRPPFRADSLLGLLGKVAAASPRPIREIESTAPEWLVALIGKLMARDPDHRFASAQAAADALEAELAWLQAPGSASPPTRDWLPATAPAADGGEGRARRRAAGFAAAAGSLLALGYALLPASGSDDPEIVKSGITASSPTRRQQDPESRWERHEVRNGSGEVVVTHTERRTMQVSATDLSAARLEVAAGDIMISAGPAGRFLVEAHRTVAVPTREAAVTRLATSTLRLANDAGSLEFCADTTADPTDRDSAEVTASYRIQVPNECSLQLVTAHGEVVFGALNGAIDLRTTHGRITAEQGLGGEFEVLAIDTDVYLSDATGRSNILTSNGDVYLGGSEGDVVVQAAGGDVHVGAVRGRTGVHAQRGNVWVDLHESPATISRFSAATGDVQIKMHGELDVTLAARGTVRSEIEFANESGEDDIPWRIAHLGAGSPRLLCHSTTGELRFLQDATSEGGADGEPHEYFGGASDDGSSGGIASGAGTSSGGIASGAGTSSGGIASGAGTSSGGIASGAGTSSGGVRSGRSGRGSSSSSAASSPSSGRSGSSSSSGTSPAAADARPPLVETPAPGKLATIEFDEPRGNIDGFVLYLPNGYGTSDRRFPVIVYLQGAFGVGGAVSDLVHWGLPRLLRDEQDSSDEGNRLMLDEFVVLCPHITRGSYADSPEVVDRMLNDVIQDEFMDSSRIYVTGLSRGGHGSWELATTLPNRFAAIAPVGGDPEDAGDLTTLRDVAVWIAHNADDQVVSIDGANRAAATLERAFDVEFVRMTPREAADLDTVTATHVFTSSPFGSHDAWTDLYSSASFYRWLLAQQRD